MTHSHDILSICLSQDLRRQSIRTFTAISDCSEPVSPAMLLAALVAHRRHLPIVSQLIEMQAKKTFPSNVTLTVNNVRYLIKTTWLDANDI